MKRSAAEGSLGGTARKDDCRIGFRRIKECPKALTAAQEDSTQPLLTMRRAVTRIML